MKRREFVQSTALLTAGLGVTQSSLAFSPEKRAKRIRPVCVFTKCLQFLSIEEMGEMLARLEFDGADLPVRPGGQVEPADVKKELPRVVNLLKKQGVAVPMIVTAITDASDQQTHDILQTAADCGIKYYRTGALKYDPTKSMQQNLDEHKKTIESLAKLNEKLGIHGGYQNHSGLNVGAPVWDLFDLLKDVNPQFMGVQYDIRHAVTEGGYSWSLGMKRIEKWIRSIDIKDFVWSKGPKGEWKHFNVPLGEGMVNFDQFFAEYSRLKVEAPISIHYEYDLGGAEAGKKQTSMSKEQIAGILKKDLDWLHQSLIKNHLEL